MVVVVTNGNTGLEPCGVTSPGLLLVGHNLQGIIFHTRIKEEVNDLRLLDWQRGQVAILQPLRAPGAITTFSSIY